MNKKTGRENINSCRPTSDKGSNSSFHELVPHYLNWKEKIKKRKRKNKCLLFISNHTWNHVNEVRNAQEYETSSNMLILIQLGI